jgi:hypothetical protein
MVRSMKTEYLLSMIVLVMKEIIVCCVESLLVSHTSFPYKYFTQVLVSTDMYSTKP